MSNSKWADPFSLFLLLPQADPRGGNGDYDQGEDLKNSQQSSQGPSRFNRMHTNPKALQLPWKPEPSK
jgi:hypothetical protein